MTIQQTYSPVSYVVSGIGPYIFSFPTIKPANIYVSIDGDVINNSTYNTTLNANQNSNPGGSLVFDVPPTGSTLTIFRLTDLDQKTLFQEYTAFPASSVEFGLDKLMMMIQEMIAGYHGINTGIDLSSPPPIGDVDPNYGEFEDLVLTNPLPLIQGGTGSTTPAGVRQALELKALAVLDTINNNQWSGEDLSLVNGGSGSSTASGARSNFGLLGVMSMSPNDPLPGNHGDIHFKYNVPLPDPTVSLSDATVTSGNSVCALFIRSDGRVSSFTDTGGIEFINEGVEWILPLDGVSSEYEVMFEWVSGNTDLGIVLDTWFDMSTSRSVSLNGVGAGTNQSVLAASIRKDGDILASAEYTLIRDNDGTTI